MDSSFREQEGSGTQKASSTGFWPSLKLRRLLLAGLVNWLAGLIKLTKEEREDAGIYTGRVGGE